jgi:hypothetical protein
MDTKEARGVLWQKCWRCAVKKSEAYTCPMTQFVNLISGKWAIPILYRLIVLTRPYALAICCGPLPPSRRKS